MLVPAPVEGVKDGHPQEPGLIASGAGGKPPQALWGRTVFVLAPPLLDQHGRLRQRVEDLPLERELCELSPERGGGLPQNLSGR